MRLNGWQRVYSLLVVAWISYWAFAAYSDFISAENRIAELQATIERYQQQIPAGSVLPEKSLFIHHFQGASPEQLLVFYKEQLTEVQQNKSLNNILILLIAVVLPVVIYLLIAWIVAGFRQTSA